MLKATKQVFLIAAGLLFFWSCKKDSKDEIPLGTFSAKVDGVLTDFRYAAEADISGVTPYRLYLRGYSNLPSISQTGIMISVFPDEKVAPGLYIENISGRPMVQMQYTEQTGAGNFSHAYASMSTANPVTITVINVDPELVKGTFSGELIGTRWDGTPMKVQVTEGRFHLRL